MTYDELLSQEGFELDRVTGSHHIFKRSGITFVTCPPQPCKKRVR
jgi:predicted RNA binding protein YcfA (HicA-like mRNA interferase family)